MENKVITGVESKILKVVPDERGRLMEILRSDDAIFNQFGQVYLTTTYPGVVKAWHYHKKQADTICCISGMICLVLWDDRPDSLTKGGLNTFCIGTYRPLLVKVPAGVYHGWKCISQEEALIINIPTQPYCYNDPDEYRMDPHLCEIPYNWDRKDG